MSMKKMLAAVAAASASAGAFAATPTIDVSAVTAFIDGLITPIGLIGASYLIVAYAIKGWKLMRSV